MKKKRNIIIIIAIVLILAITGVLYFVFTNQDKDSTLTLVEKQWIESNKNKVIDFGIVNNIAILNNSGEGLLFDFFEAIEEDTSLEFNKISYEYGEAVNEEYAFKVVDKLDKDDILVYSDNYAVISKKKVKYNSLNEISHARVGVLEKNLENINKYLACDDLSYTPYENIEDLLISYKEEKSELDFIVLPKIIYLSMEDLYKDLYINYNIDELKDNYVISLGDTKKLNNILDKYYKKWSSENYDSIYANEFTNTYFRISDTEKQSEVKFKSKRYIYGFVENAPFEIEVNGKLVGINSAIIKSFSDIANVEVTFQSYPSVDRLREAFSNGKIDFYFDKYNKAKYDLDTYLTVSPYDEQIVVVSKYGNNINVNSANSLTGESVLTLKNTKIEAELEKVKANIKSYDRLEDLMANMNDNSVVVIDEATYNFYKESNFRDYKVDARYALNGNYGYMIRDINNNEVFEKYFDFYLSFINEKSLINTGYYNALNATSTSGLLKTIVTSICSILVLIVAFLLGSRFMPNRTKKRKINNMKKEDKLKYVDMLTSLKNRNYLNENIELWDASEVYPQSIIIVDLNNIAYINDNYGHQEGDEVIKQAANILINNQMPNSDIIRTNGNEFLIYLVEYDEKQVASYIKKLTKEFKELAHGFGAAIGYSMITDGIKTIDDAVNEATLDMRNNKEELNN
ncbi:MAG: diguanylate cyclase [Bacilli bacterium]|nr:diguanylate cyclase [Bacilli bacterium]